MTFIIVSIRLNIFLAALEALNLGEPHLFCHYHHIQEELIMHNNSGEIAKEARIMSISSVLEATREEQETNQFSPSNWEQQLATWDATEQAYPIDACVQHLVSMQATTTPDAVAISQENQILNYCELNQRANQLAHYLQT